MRGASQGLGCAASVAFETNSSAVWALLGVSVKTLYSDSWTISSYKLRTAAGARAGVIQPGGVAGGTGRWHGLSPVNGHSARRGGPGYPLRVCGRSHDLLDGPAGANESDKEVRLPPPPLLRTARGQGHPPRCGLICRPGRRVAQVRFFRLN
jgi:hypothetical protein